MSVLQKLKPVAHLKIWTDGSCLNNGKALAQAGIGVFFHDKCDENISEPLSLEGKQTNQRAELWAIQRALEVVFCKYTFEETESEWSTLKTVEIITDSAYSIGCLIDWIPGWKSRGWKTSKNKPIENLDIILPTYRLLTSFQHILPTKIVLTKVKGHSDDFGNNQADLLAVDGSKRSTVHVKKEVHQIPAT